MMNEVTGVDCSINEHLVLLAEEMGKLNFNGLKGELWYEIPQAVLELVQAAPLLAGDL